MTHLMVATPCYGGMVTQRYMQSSIGLLQLGTRLGIRVSIELLGYESLITRGRNALVTRFLDSPAATHLMFIDADIGFDPAQVARMLNFGEDVVAGMYPLKLIEWEAACRGGAAAALRYVGTPCTGAALEQRRGFVTGEYAGTGFMLIRRDVLERMAAAYPETRYTAIHTAARPSDSLNQHALFDCMIDPETGHYLSEDFTFCRRWREIGGRIWLDTQSTLIHVGPYEFTGQPQAPFAPEAMERQPSLAVL